MSTLSSITAIPSFSTSNPPAKPPAAYSKFTGLTVTRTPRHHHITLILKSLHWLKSLQRIQFKVLSKVLSLTYNSLQHSQPTYLHELFTILVNQFYPILLLSGPLSTPSHQWPTHLLFSNGDISIASPRLWTALPPELRILSVL